MLLAISNPETVSSVLGGTEQPKILLSECTDKFWSLCTDRLTNKSEDQIRKWKNPRFAVMNTFVSVIGDKALKDVTRTDILQYRQWWMERIEKGEVIASTVNKNMMFTRDVLQLVGMSYEI